MTRGSLKHESLGGSGGMPPPPPPPPPPRKCLSFTYSKAIFESYLYKFRNHLSDCNLSRLMKMAMEGPELSSVPFDEILDVFKETNRRIEL